MNMKHKREEMFVFIFKMLFIDHHHIIYIIYIYNILAYRGRCLSFFIFCLLFCWPLYYIIYILL